MASNIPVIVQGNSFSLAIPMQIYYINGDQMDLQDYTPDPTDEVSVQLKGSRRNYTYTPTIDGNVANIDLSGNELADNYGVVVSVVKANGQRLRSFRTDQFFIVESSDDLTTDDIIQGLEENVIYLNTQCFVAGADGRGIESIVKTGTSGLVDTYTITYTDATTSTFNVTNGAQGAQGADGVGITSIDKTNTSGLVDTYTITMSNGTTTTFDVTNGKDGVDLGLATIVNDLTTGGSTNVLSAEMGKVLGENVDAINDAVVLPQSIDNVTWKQGSINASTDHAYRASSTNRIVLAIPTSGDLSSNVASGYYVIAHYYSVVYNDITENTQGTGYIKQDDNGWQNGDVRLNAPIGTKTIVIIVKKGTAGTQNISPSIGTTVVTNLKKYTSINGEVATLYNNVARIDTTINGLIKDSNSTKELFLGTLVQAKITTGALVADTTRLSTKSMMVVPYVGATLNFKLPNNYYIGIRSGATSGNLSNNDYWYGNGSGNNIKGLSFTFAQDVRYFRLCFAHTSDNLSTFDDITAEEVNALLESGDIQITYKNSAQNIIARNYETEKYTKAVMRDYDTSSLAKNGSLHKLPIFVHTSDLHGDALRFENMMQYADYIGVDGALVTGDMAGYTGPVSDLKYIDDIADMHTTPCYPILGNHDARDVLTAEGQNAYLEHLMTKNDVVTPQGDTYPTYYYKDLTAKKIRLIGINLYEGNHSSMGINFSQTQCEWFIVTLKSTPADYGILVMMHSSEKAPVLPSGSPYNAFLQPYTISISSLIMSAYNLIGTPFADIIDAFIGRTSRSVSYTTDGTAVTVTADFTSGVNEGVEFIAYVNGHYHTDNIGYSPNTTYPQLNLNVCCGISVYGSGTYHQLADNSDLPRDAEGATQDCFNLYAIDRRNGVVRVAKIGSNITADLTERKMLAIPYK